MPAPRARFRPLLAASAAMAAALAARAQTGADAGGPASPLDFNRDVRPLLADRCFQCHGFDARARKADLRLDTWEGLTADRDAGRAVVPGDAARSLLVARIHHRDDKQRMPPTGSGLSLNPTERATLTRWIEEGATYARHWAFLPPVAPPAPPARPGTRNAVDRFVADRLRRQGLQPSPEADRATLLRRLSLDLIGLPPTPAELDAFLADYSADAYERQVDRLLASPHFGERMALVWLDAARYADTNGFHHDNVRTAWPYRDWVIAAFNRDLPYDRFLVEQLAGDLLPAPTQDQLVASGFCRMHNINDEGGALDPEYRVEAVCDRIETIATALMGLTLTCARCHDHKYDPLTQDDYYSLYAYFNSIDERGVYAANFEQARAYPPRLAYRTAELAPELAAAEARAAAAAAELDQAAPAVDAERVAWEATFRAGRGVRWARSELLAATSAAGATLTPQADGSVRVRGDADFDSHTFVLRTAATDLRLLSFEALADPELPGGRVGLAANGNAVVSRISAVATSLRDPARRQEIEWAWAWADFEQRNDDHDVLNVLRGTKTGWALGAHQRHGSRTALLLAATPFGYAGGTEVTVTVDYRSVYPDHVVGRPRLGLGSAAADLRAEFPVVASDWFVAGPFRAASFDEAWQTAYGPEDLTAVAQGKKLGKVALQHRGDLTDGETHELKGERSAFYLVRSLRTPVARELELSLGSDDGLAVFLDGVRVHHNPARRGVAADQDRVLLSLPAGESVLVAKVVNDGGPAGFYCRLQTPGGNRLEPPALAPTALLPVERRDPALHAAFAAEWSRNNSAVFARLAGAADAARAAVQALEEQTVPVLVMRELDRPTPTQVLARGRYDAPIDSRPVSRRPPAFLGGDTAVIEPNDRLGFARWLTRPDHPLTARVHVNRIWQMLFGTGLVRSAENFGHQADWPSHPQLLDWLAAWFAGSGWDQKALIRLLVTSATYRRTSRVDPAARAVDPDDRLLAWFPRRRLPAELLRDQALFAAGALVDRIGGPSVKPYQPPGLWQEVSIGASSNTQKFVRDDGEALYRRSLYTFWKRTAPSPQMSTFDAPTREFCVVRRQITNTPLQALVLWNDVQFLEAARLLAQRSLAEPGDDDRRLEVMYRRCTGSRPDGAAAAILRRTLVAFRDRYQAAPADAAALVAAGEAPRPEHLDPAELAAWMMVASTMLNLDATLVRS